MISLFVYVHVVGVFLLLMSLLCFRRNCDAGKRYSDSFFTFNLQQQDCCETFFSAQNIVGSQWFPAAANILVWLAVNLKDFACHSLLLETVYWAVWLFVRIAVFVGFVQLSLWFVLWVRSLVLTVCCHCASDETGPCSARSIYEISTPVAVILACVSEMMICCQCGKRGWKPWNFASGHVHHDSLTA